MPSRPVTPQQKEDAARLKSLFDEWKARQRELGRDVRQEEIAHQLGLSQSALSQRLGGKMAINRDFAAKVAALIGKPVFEFSPRLAGEIEGLAKHAIEAPPDDEFADVRRLDVKVSAGHGSVPYLEEEMGALKFRRDFLRSIGVSEANAVVVTVTGASMEPTISHGAVLLVNRANREPRANAIYVFHLQGNGLVVKRVVKSGGQWLARSDNDDREAFPDFAFDESDTLIGRAVWMGARL